MAGSKLDLSGLASNLDKVIAAARELTPVAEAIGGPVVANVATMVIAATATIQNVLERSEDLKGALSTQDEAKLRAMLAELQPINDELAKAVAES